MPSLSFSSLSLSLLSSLLSLFLGLLLLLLLGDCSSFFFLLLPPIPPEDRVRGEEEEDARNSTGLGKSMELLILTYFW